VGYWADDRFVVILADCPAGVLARIAATLKQVVEGAAIPWWGDRLSVTVSVGGTTAQEGDTAAGLLSRAEQALRKSCAKKVEIV
jgi:GGDEF domain-containing protein